MTPAFSISLIMPKVSKSLMQGWIKLARDHLPNGVMTTMTREGQAIALVTEEAENGTALTIPLTRHLTCDEAEVIVQALERATTSDFEIVATSDIPPSNEETAQAVVDENAYLALCTQWAKRQHETWAQDRLANGWRYGPEVSFVDKTHPLLRQWNELPDQFRKIDTDAPQELLRLLNDQGYSVISQHELRSLLLLMKS